MRFIKALRILPRWIIILIDLSILMVSIAIAYLLRFNFSIEDVIKNNMDVGMAIYVVSGFISILVTRSYSGIVRYTTLSDAIRIISAVLIITLLAGALNFIVSRQYEANIIPLSVLIIGCFSSTLFLFLYRLLIKYIFTYYTRNVYEKINVLIFGAGQLGLITKQVISNDTSNSLKVVGFLEDDLRKVGKSFGRCRIYNAGTDLARLFKDLYVKEVIISIKDLSIERKNEIVDQCLKYQVKVRAVPEVEKWVKGELSLKQIREIRIEDLLGRESIKLDNETISEGLLNKRVCITGAAGSIGSELVRQVSKYSPANVILIDQSESPLYELERELNVYLPTKIYVADITDKKRIEQIFGMEKPEVVFHAAAYKHVPLMESNVVEAIKTNILGTKILADLAVEYEVKRFVMVSTDKAVNPTSIMGCSKRIAEIYVQSLNNYLADKLDGTAFVTTRFGNVLGSNGSVIPFFKKQISTGGPITVTHPEITRYFMTITEACQLVLEAGSIGKGGEIFIFDMGQSIKITDLAKKMVRLSGLELGKDIEIVFTGLRQGEKLYEELLSNEENTIPTHHKKIMIAKVSEYSFIEISEHISSLQESIENCSDDYLIVSLMKEIVPEFKSNSSAFGILDKSEFPMNHINLNPG